MTNKEAIVHLKCLRNMALGDVMKEAFTKAIKALENQPFDADEYRRRLVDKYSDGDEATDVDNGITIALDLLDEMEEETT